MNTIGDKGFSLKMDKNEWFQNWDTISTVNIKEEYVFIFAPNSPNYFFPKHAMELEEYSILKDMIKQNVLLKNSIKDEVSQPD